jgi:hypothetical protein
MAESKEKPAKVKRDRQVTRLTDGQGGSLEVFAQGTKAGRFESYAKHTVRDEKGKVNKGASKGSGIAGDHATFDEAKTAANGIIEGAKALGWTVKSSGGGAAGRKDAFTLDSLPKPAKAPKK